LATPAIPDDPRVQKENESRLLFNAQRKRNLENVFVIGDVLMDANSITLPPEAERNRILDSAQASTFWGVSRSHWRRLYQSRRVPTPIKIGERKLGWRVGDLIDGLNERANAPTR
jgi:predicted DNA-binding transcriptional regulator AlpA